MANLSDQTRAEQVLAYLQEHRGDWVNGTELCNERVGGSEGLKRVRELRAAGKPIETRRHPNPAIDQWQYRLDVVSPLRRSSGLVFGEHIVCPACKGRGDYSDGFLDDGKTPKPRLPCRACGGAKVIHT